MAELVGAGTGAEPRRRLSRPRRRSRRRATSLSVKPWGTVYVDGKERGVSPPLKKLTLTAGVHMVKIANPGFPDHISRIVVKKGAPGTIAHDFAAKSK